MKRCTKCGEEKSLDAFRRNRATKDGRTTQCKSCMSEAARRYRSTFAGQAKEREYRQRTIARQRLRSKRWREEHPDAARAACRAWRGRNKESEQQRVRDYLAANPDVRRRNQARRRALKASVPQGDAQDAAIYAKILRGGICELCGANAPIEVDHIDPLSIGGEHGWKNFAGLCKSCNTAKGTLALVLYLLR